MFSRQPVNPVFRLTIKLMERAGYEAIVAKNGAEGMGKVQEDMPMKPYLLYINNP